jgi:hypothetical protein
MTQPMQGGGTTVADREYPPVAVPQHLDSRPVDNRPPMVEQPTVTTQDVQAAAEGVVEESGDFIEFMGDRFRLARSIGLMPLMKFAHASESGLDTEDMRGMAALYAMIRDCVDQERPQQPVIDGATGEPMRDESGAVVMADAGMSEWDRFEKHSIDTKAEGEDFTDFINDAIKVISARPSRRRGSSSATSPATSEKSRATSSSPAIPVRPGSEGLMDVADLARSTG